MGKVRAQKPPTPTEVVNGPVPQASEPFAEAAPVSVMLDMGPTCQLKGRRCSTGRLLITFTHPAYSFGIMMAPELAQRLANGINAALAKSAGVKT